MERRDTVTLGKTQYYIGLAVLIVSLLSSVISLGYNLRRVDEAEARITNIENAGSINARLSANDIKWITDNIRSMQSQLCRVEDKIDKHMAK
jgi:hypothetical protein